MSWHLRVPSSAACTKVFRPRTSPNCVTGHLSELRKEILCQEPDEARGRAGTVFRRDMALQAANPHRRLARVLGANEVRGRRRLVGDRDRGRVQLAADAVRTTPPVLQWDQSRTADRHLALALAPGAAERVGDHDGGMMGELGAEPTG